MDATGEGEKGRTGETHGGAALRAAVVVKDPGYKPRMDAFCCLHPGSFATIWRRPKAAAPPCVFSFLPFSCLLFLHRAVRPSSLRRI